MIRRLVTTLAAAVLTVGLVGCGNGDSAPTQPSDVTAGGSATCEAAARAKCRGADLSGADLS
ncbi:MAG: nuclear transport factor 2 family protein, partial [Actinomycetota bacterium]